MHSQACDSARKAPEVFLTRCNCKVNTLKLQSQHVATAKSTRREKAAFLCSSISCSMTKEVSHKLADKEDDTRSSFADEIDEGTIGVEGSLGV